MALLCSIFTSSNQLQFLEYFILQFVIPAQKLYRRLNQVYEGCLRLCKGHRLLGNTPRQEVGSDDRSRRGFFMSDSSVVETSKSPAQELTRTPLRFILKLVSLC